MKSQTTGSFWRHYWALPPEIRQRAAKAYKLWRDDPAHPSLLDERLARARQERALTPESGPGRRLTRVDTLCRAIGQIERRHRVAGLLWVSWRRQAHPSRADPDRTRLVVTDVVEQTGAVEKCRAAYGWRAFVTDMGADHLPRLPA